MRWPLSLLLLIVPNLPSIGALTPLQQIKRDFAALRMKSTTRHLMRPLTPRGREETLAIKQKVLGPDHPTVATSLNNLGLLLQARGRLVATFVVPGRGAVPRGKARGARPQATGHAQLGVNANSRYTY